MTYACLVWEFAADTHILKLQNLKTRGTPVRELHMASQEPYIYYYVTKLCRQQAEVVQTHEHANVRDIGKDKGRHRKCKRLTLGGGH
jgi:hypothetical protein